jgi:hypothetical protein
VLIQVNVLLSWVVVRTDGYITMFCNIPFVKGAMQPLYGTCIYVLPDFFLGVPLEHLQQMM